MLSAIEALLSILDHLLTLFMSHQDKQQGRQEAEEEYRLKALEAREKANEIDSRPDPTDKRGILDRM